MNYVISLVSAVAVCAAGCSETSGSAGSGGMGGVGGDGGRAGVDPNVADHEKLLECRNDTWCEQALAQEPLCQSLAPRPMSCIDALAQVIEGGDPFTMNHVACVLAMLRDRTPGLYRVELDHGYTSGHEGARHAFAITPSGMIERGVVEYVELDASSSTIRLLPTERCEPKSPDFYDGCAELAFSWEDGGPGEQEAWDCVFPDWADPGLPLSDPPWFSNCVPLSPTCE